MSNTRFSLKLVQCTMRFISPQLKPPRLIAKDKGVRLGGRKWEEGLAWRVTRPAHLHGGGRRTSGGGGSVGTVFGHRLVVDVVSAEAALLAVGHIMISRLRYQCATRTSEIMRKGVGWVKELGGETRYIVAWKGGWGLIWTWIWTWIWIWMWTRMV